MAESFQTDQSDRVPVPGSLAPYSLDQVAPELRPQLEHAASTITTGLNADICHIYKLCSSQDVLQLVAGLGCPHGALHRLSVKPEPKSLEAYALTSHTTVVAEHLDRERRFPRPAVDLHRASSGLAVVIEGETAPFGVCSVYSRRPRSFSSGEIELVEEVSCALTELFRSARLVRDRARFAAVAMSVDEAVVELTLDGRIFGWNAAAETLYGYSIADVAGRPVSLLFPQAADQERAAMLDAVRSGRSKARVETVVRRRDGMTLDVELRLVPIVLTDGRVTAASMIARDLTQQRKADHERRELLDRLQHSQRMEIIGQLAGGLAHDFNNLLTIITGCSEFIQGRIADETVLEDLRQIDHASRSAVQLTRHLLAFGRRPVVRATELDLTEVVRSARGMLRRLVGPRVQLIVLEGQCAVFVRADAIQVERVLINLAVNARDAMPEGGRIFIESSHTTITEQQAGVRPDLRPGTFGRLQITDTGTGIEPSALTRIFEPFFSTKEDWRGSGLGLSTVRDIVELSGGFVTVESQRGEGATFNLYFPALELETAA
jgi:PAS domain S-box-containing protein